MKRVPQQPEEHFEAVLREGHRRARRVNDAIEDFTKYLDENPTKAAQDLLFIVPKWMDACQAIAVSRFGYDLENRKKREDFAVETFQDALEFVQLMNHYYTNDLVMERWVAFQDEGMVGKQLAQAVCDAFIGAYKERPGLAAVGIESLEACLPDRFKGLVLSTYLTSYLATHTSLHANPRLKHSIDELREEGESRFARLLKELPAEALAAYRDRPRDVGNLMEIRTEAARRLEKRDAPPVPDMRDLAEFADRETREALLKRGKDAGLPPKEYELFKLLVEKPGISSREAAHKLGITAGAVRTLKSRINRTLGAA
jgi:DNA-binding CsgD family transcriptional regulator